MNEAEKGIKAMEDKYKDSWAIAEYLAPKWIMPNFIKSKDRQVYEQAQRNFINAVLRQESWAVISDSEFDNARKQYFPAPWDGDSVLNQKRNNREMVIYNMLKSAWKDEQWRDIGNIWKELKNSTSWTAKQPTWRVKWKTTWRVK
jgi:hypothetical protein